MIGRSLKAPEFGLKMIERFPLGLTVAERNPVRGKKQATWLNLQPDAATHRRAEKVLGIGGLGGPGKQLLAGGPIHTLTLHVVSP